MEVSVMMTESVLVMMDLKKMEKEYVKVSDFLYLPYHKGPRVDMNEEISVCCVAVFCYSIVHATTGYLVISPTSDLANITFANVLGRFAKAKSRFANVLLVTSPMY